jgi:hypothetical protein
MSTFLKFQYENANKIKNKPFGPIKNFISFYEIEKRAPKSREAIPLNFFQRWLCYLPRGRSGEPGNQSQKIFEKIIMYISYI